MKEPNYKRTKYVCYFTSMMMAAAFALPPLLFVTFQELYGISYTLLGTLVLINFCIQLTVDLIFTFFSRHFHLRKLIRLMPLMTALGFCVYALVPYFLPQYAYPGLVAGTLIFSVAAGMSEVLVSPVVAALPSDNPNKEMSMLHSLYGYGCMAVIIISTLFLHFIGSRYWIYLTIFWAIPHIIAAILLVKTDLPNLNTAESTVKSAKIGKKAKGLALCVICIFLGGAVECTMSNWLSAFTENALSIPKVWGDILGAALFAAALAFTRTAYAKYGKNIFNALTVSMGCSILCYLVVALSPNGAVSLVACVALGIFSAMLWPGTLILMEENMPALGVTAYALMASGGDLGASIAPQAVGIVVDNVAVTDWAKSIGDSLSLSPEQVGFKAGMLLAAIFPVLGVILLLYMRKFFRNAKKEPPGKTGGSSYAGIALCSSRNT